MGCGTFSYGSVEKEERLRQPDRHGHDTHLQGVDLIGSGTIINQAHGTVEHPND
jgi:hypothetical protein